MKFKENTSTEPDVIETLGSVVEIKIDDVEEKEEPTKTSSKDVDEVIKMLAEVINCASELITKLNKTRA